MKRANSRSIAGTTVMIVAIAVFTGAYASGRNGMLSEPHDMVLTPGTILDLRATTRLSSDVTPLGAPITATALRALVDLRGDTVIPVGAQFRGTVTAIAAGAGSGEPGVLDVELGSVTYGDRMHRIATRVVSLGTYSLGRGKVNHPRDRTIVLPAGGVIRLALTRPFAPEKSSAE
jgi:hypothetical protein